LAIPARRANRFTVRVGGVAVHPPALGAQEDRPGGPLGDVEVEGTGCPRRQGDDDVLSALAHDLEGPVTTLEVEAIDVGTKRFRNPQPVQRQ
jgi:hypothetical protein